MERPPPSSACRWPPSADCLPDGRYSVAAPVWPAALLHVGFLLSGGLMTAGNSLFLQKPRRFWQILLLNVLLCAVWIPLLSRTLDLTYPPLLVIQVPCTSSPVPGDTTGASRLSRSATSTGPGEYMGLYGLFYLIVASFAPQPLDRVPVLLAAAGAGSAGSGGDAHLRPQHHSGRFSFGRLPVLLVPAVLACWLWPPALCYWPPGGELIPIFQAVGDLLEGALIAVFRFLTSLPGPLRRVRRMSSAAGGGSEAALPVESASGPAIAPQLVTALLLLSLAALVLAGVVALVRWLWRSRGRIRLPEEDDDDGLVRQLSGPPWPALPAGPAPAGQGISAAVRRNPRAALLNWSTGAPAALPPSKPGDPPGVSGTSGRGAPPGRWMRPCRLGTAFWWTMWSGACTARFPPPLPGAGAGAALHCP